MKEDFLNDNDPVWTSTCICGWKSEKLTKEDSWVACSEHQKTCIKWQKALAKGQKRSLKVKKAYDTYQASYKIEGLVKELGMNAVRKILNQMAKGKTVDNFYEEYNDIRGGF